MLMDHPPEPPPAGAAPSPDGTADRPAAPVTSIQHFESPDAVEAASMAEQRAADPATENTGAPPDPNRGRDVARGSASVPGAGPRPEAARGSARVRPTPPAGPVVSRPAITDIQTTSGVPATPIPEAGQQQGTDRGESPKPDKSPTAAEGAEGAGKVVNGAVPGGTPAAGAEAAAGAGVNGSAAAEAAKARPETPV
jgi:hypothetical protein